MRTAEIYFNGELIQKVKCDGIHSVFSKDANVLVIGKEISDIKIVAVVPFTHLILFKDDRLD